MRMEISSRPDVIETVQLREGGPGASEEWQSGRQGAGLISKELP